MTATPAGYTGQPDHEALIGLGQEPAEIAEAKNTVQDLLGAWENNGRLGSTGAGTENIALADEIVTTLLKTGALLPEQKIEGNNNPFEHIDSQTLLEADFDLMRAPGGYLRWGHPGADTHAVVAVEAGQHILFHGGTGSGKTVASHSAAYSALAQGYDLTIIDLQKTGIDWDWLTADAEVISTTSGAIAALDQQHEETGRIHQVLKCQSVSSFYRLDDARPRLLVFDGVAHLGFHTGETLGEEHHHITHRVNQLLVASSSAGLTIIATWQAPLDLLQRKVLANFFEVVSFGDAASRQAARDGHDVPDALPAGTAYVQPGGFAVRAWYSDIEEIVEELSAAREARQAVIGD